MAVFICVIPVFTRHFEYSKFPHLFAPAEQYARFENDFDYLHRDGAGAGAFKKEKMLPSVCTFQMHSFIQRQHVFDGAV